jgi:hypothetical protein
MIQKRLRVFCVLAILIISIQAFSQEEESDELSLDDETTETVSTPELNIDKKESAVVENANLASPLEAMQRENALYGFSVGLSTSIVSFFEKYPITFTDGRDSKEVNLKNDLQSTGFTLRYAIAPFNKVGADLNFSYLKSLNHSQTQYAESMTINKVEFNLTYAIKVADSVPLYFLAGFGAQEVSSESKNGFEYFVDRNGYGIQSGVGVVLMKRINLEGLFAYYQHRIGTRVLTDIGKTSSGNVDSESNKVIAQGLVMRGTYSFNF